MKEKPAPDSHSESAESAEQVGEQAALDSNDKPTEQVSEKATPESRNGLIAQVIGNISLLTAVLVYMGWAYENALLEYFRVSPLSLNIGVLEYVLKSLSFFFHPVIIFSAVILIIIIVIAAPRLGRLIQAADHSTIGPILQSDAAVGLGLLIPVGLAWFGLQKNWLASWFTSYPEVFYVVVALVGVGPLLLTCSARARNRGLLSYAIAIVVAAICALWIGGLYANSLGFKEAGNFARRLPTQTAVALYSVKPLALSGPGVTCEPLPVGSLYNYRCEGLRLLYAAPGAYYLLLPVDWTRQQGHTYIIDDSDQIRIEFY